MSADSLPQRWSPFHPGRVLGAIHGLREGNFPAWASVALVSAAAVPYRIQGRFGPFAGISILDLLILAMFPFLVYWAVRDREVPVGDRVVFSLITLPWVVGIASIVWSENPDLSIKTVISYGFPVVMYLVTVRLFRRLTSAQIMNLFALFCVLCLVACAFGYLRVPGFDFFAGSGENVDTDELQDRLASIATRLGHPFIGLSNDFAGVISFFIFPLAVYGLFQKKRVIVSVAVLASIGLILTFSRGMFLATAIGSLILLARYRGIGSAALALVTAVIMAVTGYLAAEDASIPLPGKAMTVRELAESRLSTSNVSARTGSYEKAWDLIGERPNWGYGVGVMAPRGQDRLQSAIHNTYLQQILFFGIPIGLAVGAALIALPFRFRRISVPPGLASHVRDAVALSVVVQLVGFASQTSFEAIMPRYLFYFGVAASACLIDVLRREEEAKIASN